MSKFVRYLTPVAFAFLVIVLPARADAPAVIDVIGKTVAIYDDNGTFKEEQAKEAFLGGRDLKTNPIPVLQKNDKGLLLIDYGATKLWIGEDDVKLNAEKLSIIKCVDVVRTKTADTVAAAAMGLGGCPK